MTQVKYSRDTKRVHSFTKRRAEAIEAALKKHMNLPGDNRDRVKELSDSGAFVRVEDSLGAMTSFELYGVTIIRVRDFIKNNYLDFKIEIMELT